MRPLCRIAPWILMACLMAAAALPGCSTAKDAGVEQARLSLDKGEWDKAIQAAGEALADDPSDVESALLLSSAYAGRAGIQLSRIAAAIADRSRERDLFDLLQDEYRLFRSGGIGGPDLDLAIAALTDQLQPQPEAANPLYRDRFFQHGLLLVVKIFLRPAMLAQALEDAEIQAGVLGEENEGSVEQALLQADDAFLQSGLAEDDPMVQHVRQTWCVLRAAWGDSDGFDVRALRDILRCQLSPDDGASLTAADFESPSITSCSDFAYDACATAGPTEQ